MALFQPPLLCRRAGTDPRPSWQVVCHVNDIPRAGDFRTFDFIGESIIVIRGRDGVPCAFSNVCLHRAAKLVDGPTGQCGRIVCPYHAWTYDLEGRLVGVPLRQTYPDLRLGERRLPPVELEVFKGFIFVRLEGGGPSIAEMMAPYAEELEPYRFEALQPFGRVTVQSRTVNWKTIGDNYSDGLHVTVGHPGLARLFGCSYGFEASPWVDKMWGQLRDAPSDNLSERAYQTLLPDVEHLPAERKRLWAYYKLWPNLAFDVYPDQIDFMQWIPGFADRDPDPRDRIYPARRKPRDEGRALPELAYQSPGQRRGQRTSGARAAGDGLAPVRAWPTERDGGLPAQFCPQATRPDPRSPTAPPARRLGRLRVWSCQHLRLGKGLAAIGGVVVGASST
jgi:nitrite reductase/ring-hydroxylating ferredoxin subunit